MARLIARFWDVNRGAIRVGGADVKSLDPEHLMGYMVEQGTRQQLMQNSGLYASLFNIQQQSLGCGLR